MSQQMPYAPAPPAAPQQPKNGLGTAALVLGIIGVVLAFFYVGGLLGLLALIFGIIGLGKVKKGEATNKGVALTGLILGVVSMVITIAMVIFTVFLVDKAVDELDKLEKDLAATAPKDPGAGGEAPKDGELLKLGDGMEFDDGLVATVTEVKKYTPDEFAVGHEAGNDAYEVTVQIENGSDATVDLALGTVEATAGEEGTPAESIIDADSLGMFEGSVTAGKKTTQTFGFSVPKGTKNLVLEVSPSFDYESVFWDVKL
ncbi:MULTISPECIES: DUF4190 domain-containing protein [Streptomyces]|uniref:DUF4190 domain-containing protein n=1 Tax=Streptomyces TaxID=1883 RepID=UPI000A440427|nr:MULTISPECIES: DUF4190 domain-containing protein [Streptomyces]MDH6226565.1 hypothetical protein [Streptomyces sp. MJP52]